MQSVESNYIIHWQISCNFVSQLLTKLWILSLGVLSITILVSLLLYLILHYYRSGHSLNFIDRSIQVGKIGLRFKCILHNWTIDNAWLFICWVKGSTQDLYWLCIFIGTMHKKWSFLVRISPVNVTKLARNFGFGTFAKEILNRRLHFLCSESTIFSDLCSTRSTEVTWLLLLKPKIRSQVDSNNAIYTCWFNPTLE